MRGRSHRSPEARTIAGFPVTGSDRTCTTRQLWHGEEGFTLLEMLTVVTILGILVTLVEPSYRQSILKAREASLKQSLFVMREVMDQYRADQGRFPASLAQVVAAGYLRAVPRDPFTQSDQTWQEMVDPMEGGISDVHSGSDLVGTNGTPYNEW